MIRFCVVLFIQPTIVDIDNSVVTASMRLHCHVIRVMQMTLSSRLDRLLRALRKRCLNGSAGDSPSASCSLGPCTGRCF